MYVKANLVCRGGRRGNMDNHGDGNPSKRRLCPKQSLLTMTSDSVFRSSQGDTCHTGGHNVRELFSGPEFLNAKCAAAAAAPDEQTTDDLTSRTARSGSGVFDNQAIDFFPTFFSLLAIPS